jgi:hypothetical protein
MSEEQESIDDQNVTKINERSVRYQQRYLALEELLEFAVESGKLEPPELAVEVKQLKQILFYTPIENLSFEEICQAEAQLEQYYTKIAQLIRPVSLLTLRATNENYQISRPWWKAFFLGSGSVGRNFFRQLFWVAVLLVCIMFLRQYMTLDEDVKNSAFLKFIDPFLYGALGALIYLYKSLTERYINRTLHPKELYTQWLRLFMGGLVGGLLVNLLHILPNNEILNNAVSAIVVGFLAGYSVEFFYNTLDKAINAITPYTTVAQPTVNMTPQQIQIDNLTKRLMEMNNEADKETIRRLLEKLV